MTKQRTLRIGAATFEASGDPSNSVGAGPSIIDEHEEQRTTKRKWGSLLDILRDVVFANSLYLTGHEQQVLLFIFRRTRMYGNVWEKIPLRHFTEGVWSKRGGNVCSRLIMKVNSVATALKHLKGKGIIECREHSTAAYEYRVVEPSELGGHDIISYLVEHQPNQMEVVLRELQTNRQRLPPAYLEILKAGKSDAKMPEASIRPDIRGMPPPVKRAVPLGIEPSTNKPTNREKKPISNLAPAGARPVKISLLGKKGKLRMLPKPTRLTDDPDKLNSAKLALSNAVQWQDERRKARISQSDLLMWQKVWLDEMGARWPDGRVKFSVSAFRNLKLAVEERGFPANDMPTFMQWTITNWNYLRSHVFSFNFRKPYGPEMPDVDFVIRMLPKMYAAFVRQRRVHAPISYARPRSPPEPLAKMAPINREKTEAARIKMALPKWD